VTGRGSDRPGPHASPSDTPGPLRLLLVDDEPELKAICAEALKGIGFAVDTAADGLQAAQFVAANAYDVIVTDISMPGITGVEFLRRVRERDVDLPVILITGVPELASAVHAVEYGAFRYLVKPVAMATLEETALRAARLHALARLKRRALEVTGGSDALADVATLQIKLERSLRSLWMAYQPIVSVSERRVFAYEAFVRSNDPSLPTPDDLLRAAERAGRLPELGRRVRELVTAQAGSAPQGVLIFVNLHPSDLSDDELLSRQSPLSTLAPRVVLELTERASLAAVRDLPARVAALRALGYRLAVDDLGAGYSGLSTFAQLAPDVVKLDMSLVRDVQSQPTKQSVVRSIAALCGELGMRVVGEGVETVAERDVLARLGCTLQQGYLFGRPMPGFGEPAL
jgi:EAL domain-containing protein (putative c-di-GMP-specific phosphodiesterase class I)